jgi:hypothetical protein
MWRRLGQIAGAMFYFNHFRPPNPCPFLPLSRAEWDVCDDTYFYPPPPFPLAPPLGRAEWNVCDDKPFHPPFPLRIGRAEWDVWGSKTSHLLRHRRRVLRCLENLKSLAPLWIEIETLEILEGMLRQDLWVLNHDLASTCNSMHTPKIVPADNSETRNW